ncbi:hypothetical protein EVG20_g6559 [Dentipellis fragilis]|uniref:Uncharacterized protein n=1 Tax=Dentipellis fragilis TaxID=205917 RepID=A0A4Y9YJV4_9AGAM|nr:hypothetical protein EVG20_g6559 [Dentipellis fragilis]
MIWRVAQQFGLTPQVYIRYEGDRFCAEGYSALVPTVPKLCTDESPERRLLDQLEYDFGAITIDPYGVASMYEEFYWVTELKPLSTIESPYMAYGNEAVLAYAYGEVCLVIWVGSPEKRADAWPTNLEL